MVVCRSAKSKIWDTERTEEGRQELKEMQRKVTAQVQV